MARNLPRPAHDLRSARTRLDGTLTGPRTCLDLPPRGSSPSTHNGRLMTDLHVLLPAATDVRCRLRRVEGQTHGLLRMWDAGRPPADMLDQIAAARAALAGVAVAIVLAETETRLHAAADTATRSPDDDVLALVIRLLRQH